MKRLTRHICYFCMVLFTVFTMSCERDTWFTDLASRGSGQPVNVLLSFEVPQADEVAVTRTMSELEEHNIGQRDVRMDSAPALRTSSVQRSV